ncbi:hypothetical protein SISNIDRAFT_199624 [Sistotremastrum niveocremeum HHB9708]|uniref:Uncharacterized protein n=1 Tax=Sistotremastrum niveocremeum HHB9708 TaxID=1314777 RepID=A0A164ZNJ7_9AGAM|nr:hypothetical protein SISNIDRAFT_199624 [Sistotremastrum niveocremeum HHB9708]
MILIASKASLPAFRVVKSSKCCTRIFPSRGINTLENLNSDAKHNDAFLESAGVPGVVSLCLNRPVSRNAISLRLLKEFRLCLESIYSRKDACYSFNISCGFLCRG